MFKRTLTNSLIRLSVVVLLTQSSLSLADVIDGEELVDPTRPLFLDVSGGADEGLQERVGNVGSSTYEVSFVRVGSSSSLAVINGQRATIGDVIGGATVISIDRSGVTLMVNDEERRVNIYEHDIKAQAANQ